MLINNIVVKDDLGPEFNSAPGFEYRGNTFVFADVENRDEFIRTSTEEELDEVITSAEQETSSAENISL